MNKNQGEIVDDFARRPAFAGGLWTRLKISARKSRFTLALSFLPVFKRLCDILAAMLLMALLLPLISVFYIIQGAGQRIFATLPRTGRWGEPFEEYRFGLQNSRLQRIVEAAGLVRLPVLINILRGDMSFVGPRPLAREEFRKLPAAALRRMDARPGLLCLWWVRMRSNVGYDGEIAADLEYVGGQSLKSDLGLLVKSVPAYFFGTAGAAYAEKIALLDIPLANFSMQDAIDQVMARLGSGERSQICFVNADCANLAWNNSAYMSVLHGSAFNLADGIGLKLAGKLTGQEIRQNVNGTDMFPRLMKALENSGRSVFFFGARPDVNDALLEKLHRDYPGLKIAGGQHGYFKPEEADLVIEKISTAAPDLLLVAFGAPRQDIWIAGNLSKLPVKVAMGVGGLFDFFSGRITRAPVWMREIGMEWFFRFLQEPGRMWKRYFVGNFVFMYRVVRSRAGMRAPSLEL